ncbi:PREDICTED: probable RNA helicase SDE3 [Populus euphratica]|uniref:Probable RNA helicase SDE3 n=1 Tax=Populus euphratica TaxID=75702 RepID=A0AAJ6X1H6_POPEU|nr:PREDICTED: probable RNA helicase SDE3 [Populus euphratica]
MSEFLEFLKCMLCCVEENEEDLLVVLGSRSTSNSSDVGSSFTRSVRRVSDRLLGSNNYTYVPIYSCDPPPSSPALPQSSSRLLSPSSIPTPSWPNPPTSSSNQPRSLHIPATFSSRPSPPARSTTSSNASPQATTLSFTSSPFPPPLSTSSSKSSHKTHPTAFHPAPSPKPLPSFLKPGSSSSKPSPSSPKASPSSSSSKQPPSFKPTLSQVSPDSINEQTKVSYVRVQKGMSPIYAIPKDIEDLIKTDKVPGVLNKPLSLSTYKDYFAALLYAEDFYIEKWSEFKLENITLKLQRAEIIKKSRRNEYLNETYEKDDKIFVEFEIDSCCERRPFLLSRDFVFARPSGQKTEPCQGIIYRVERSTRVLVEFGEDFLLQHHSTRKYDVSFSFNRVCLKRAHQAIEAASDPSFRSFLFPDGVSKKIFPISTPLHFCNHKLDVYQSSAVREILSFQGPPPYLVEGPLCLSKFSKQLSRTGLVIQEAVLQIYQSSPKLRILICAPINRTCDLLMQSLNNDIPESDMFRANAAFREIDGVPIDILPSCAYKGECFTCPSLQELRKFRVILCTFVSSFRLHNEGIAAGHFSHIFLVDASSATEPEAMVPLANLASEETSVIVTGVPGNHSGWVRSSIARKNGLMTSYFERLRNSKPYRSLLPKFITQLVDPEKESVGDYSYASVSYD